MKTALDRVKASLAGKSAEPVETTVRVPVVEDVKVGGRVVRRTVQRDVVHVGHHVIPNLAGDVLAVAESVPVEKRDDIVEALILGCSACRSDERVFHNAPDVFHVVKLAGGQPAPPVED